jgi:peptide/nickel transport system substrate-binding protein
MLAEWVIAAKRTRMQRQVALLFISALVLAPSACKQQPAGAPTVVVIGGEPKVRDPSLGPLSPADAVLVGSIAQGLVRFDAGGNIVGGLAERWNVSDDGLSYIFRIASTKWADGRDVTAQQVARLLKRSIAARSKNPLRDSLGAIDDIVAMTDRVIEIRLTAPRPNLLSLLAQPELAVLKGSQGTGPFTAAAEQQTAGTVRLTREVFSPDEEETRKDEVLLSGAAAQQVVESFAAGKSDLVLGGTFADLAFAQRVKLPRGALRFDPASGLFGLVPVRSGDALDDPAVRHLLSQAINRDALIGALAVPGLAPRATVLEPGLDGIPSPSAPAWFGVPLDNRRAALVADANRLFGKTQKPTIRVALPEGPGADLLLQDLSRDWGALGFAVERATGPIPADFKLVDLVAPSSSPAWFVRQFRCEVTAVCDADADALMDSARQSQVPAQRYALLIQAATKIDDKQLFIAISAPVRWSLVSARIQGFAANRYAVHPLTDLERTSGAGD